MCGRKVVIDKMQAVGQKHGSRFQVGKEITGYACTTREYPSEENCFERWQKEAKRWGTHYHDLIRIGPGS